MSERKDSYSVSPEKPKGTPQGPPPPPPPGPKKMAESINKQDLIAQIATQAQTIERLSKEINRLEGEIKIRKAMMANYADMCEGYRKMNHDYLEIIEFYKQPLIMVKK